MDILSHSNVPEHAVETLQGLDAMRKVSPEYCDFCIENDNETFPCHRSILCLHSEYFRAMFSGDFVEKRSNKTLLKDVDTKSLSEVLDFLYTGKIEINQSSVERIMATATRFQFQKVVDVCVSYLRHQIDETNSLDIYNFGKRLAIPGLAEAARHFTYERLESVFEVNDVIKDMTSQDVEKILQDELAKVHGEEQIIMSILKWISFDQSKRLKEMEKLIQSVDWSKLSTKFILRTLLYYPLVASSKSTKDVIVKKVKKVLDESSQSRMTEDALAEQNRLLTTHRSMDPILGGDKQSCVQDVLLLIGGLTLGEAERGDYSQPNVMCYIPRHNKWESRAQWPERRLRGFSVTKFYNDVIVTGGCHFVEMKRTNKKICWKYTPETDCWSKLSDMVQPRSFHSSCQVNGELFVVGEAFSEKIDMEVYCTQSGNWTVMKKNAPRLIRNFTVASCNGKIMLMGSAENSPKLVLQCYNPSIDQWNQFRSPNVPRHLSAPVCCTSPDGSSLFLVGDNSQKVFVFNPNSNDWSRAEDMQNLHSNGGFAFVGKTLYVTGGHWDEDGYLDQMESYDLKTGTWISRGALPHLWLYHSCTSVSLTVTM